MRGKRDKNNFIIQIVTLLAKFNSIIYVSYFHEHIHCMPFGRVIFEILFFFRNKLFRSIC